MSEHAYSSRSEITRCIWESPLGPLGLVSRGGKLAQITFPVDPVSFPFAVERTFGSVGKESQEPFTEVTKQLGEYFEGRRLVFRLSMDLEVSAAGIVRRVAMHDSSVPIEQVKCLAGVLRGATVPRDSTGPVQVAVTIPFP